MTTALIATCTIYICDSHAACIFHSITYRNFRSLFSFAGHPCTCGHFNFCDLQLKLKSLLVNLIPPATFLSLLLPISIHPKSFSGPLTDKKGALVRTEPPAEDAEEAGGVLEDPGEACEGP